MPSNFVSKLRRYALQRLAENPMVLPINPAAMTLFADYCRQYQSVFPRADQRRHFVCYLAGLLSDTPRKNIGAIASRAHTEDPVSTGMSQSLQHFVSRSPWDAESLSARYRALVGAALPKVGSTLVVHDGVIPKKGRHSVGVQRQFARSLGRKINCQLAVVLGLCGPEGYCPLALRLYLPASWLRENAKRLQTEVPEIHRNPQTKAQIALEMIGRLRSEGIVVGSVTSEVGYAQNSDFREGVTHLGLPLAEPAQAQPTIAVALRSFGEIKATFGLDHFEGRNWNGWHHHASLVLAAFGYRQLTGDGISGENGRL